MFAIGGMEIPDDYVLTSADGYIKALTKLLDRTPSRIIGMPKFILLIIQPILLQRRSNK